VTPHWRTETVLLLCAGMREAGDYSAAPVLADALVEAGYDDADVLASLRRHAPPRPEIEREVAILYSDETAAAVRRIAEFAGFLGYGGSPGNHGEMTYDMLMTAATAYVDTGDDGLDDGSMNWSNASMDRDTMAAFWADWALVVGRAPPPSYTTGEFLSCEC